MCDICRQYRCPGACPNAPDPTPFATCSECGGDILDGDTYYEILDEPICEECVWNARKTAEVRDVQIICAKNLT